MAGTEGAALATARPLRLGTLRATQSSPTPRSPSKAPGVSFRRRRRLNGHPARWARDTMRGGSAGRGAAIGKRATAGRVTRSRKRGQRVGSEGSARGTGRDRGRGGGRDGGKGGGKGGARGRRASSKGRQETVSGERSGLSGVRGTAGRAEGAGQESGGEGREENGEEGIFQFEVAFRPLSGGYGVYARGRPRGGGTTGG